MRVLITGSSGQIGTNVGLELLQRGDEVQGIDRSDDDTLGGAKRLLERIEDQLPKRFSRQLPFSCFFGKRRAPRDRCADGVAPRIDRRLDARHIGTIGRP